MQVERPTISVDQVVPQASQCGCSGTYGYDRRAKEGGLSKEVVSALQGEEDARGSDDRERTWEVHLHCGPGMVVHQGIHHSLERIHDDLLLSHVSRRPSQ